MRTVLATLAGLLRARRVGGSAAGGHLLTPVALAQGNVTSSRMAVLRKD